MVQGGFSARWAHRAQSGAIEVKAGAPKAFLHASIASHREIDVSFALPATSS
jgi:hypothetical protein